MTEVLLLLLLALTLTLAWAAVTAAGSSPATVGRLAGAALRNITADTSRRARPCQGAPGRRSGAMTALALRGHVTPAAPVPTALLPARPPGALARALKPVASGVNAFAGALSRPPRTEPEHEATAVHPDGQAAHNDGQAARTVQDTPRPREGGGRPGGADGARRHRVTA
ncbi:hypothetical protein [Streptomyces sp. enrichment culture]|uniref:hypothetical protein n=1 Tax=Streptomyces sp. enrichment culture TaxID=1795815 RepID=UPI003F54C5D2